MKYLIRVVLNPLDTHMYPCLLIMQKKDINYPHMSFY